MTLLIQLEKNGRSLAAERRIETHCGLEYIIAPICLARERRRRFNGGRIQYENSWE